MKSYICGISVLAILFAKSATTQNLPLSVESGPVCSFTLRAGDNAILRTNEWNFAVNNGNNTLQQASLWIANPASGPLYSSAGRKCGFDPYLKCDDQNKGTSTDEPIDKDGSPFAIGNNGTLSFHNSTIFFICRRNAFTKKGDESVVEGSNGDDLQDYPFIYPPKNTTNNVRDFQNCTQSTLIADRCFEGSSEYTVAAAAAIAMSTMSTTNTATGTSIASVTQTSSIGSESSSAPASSTASVNTNTGGQMDSNSAVVVGLIVGAAGAFAWI